VVADEVAEGVPPVDLVGMVSASETPAIDRTTTVDTSAMSHVLFRGLTAEEL
jgi:hypothetical protein